MPLTRAQYQILHVAKRQCDLTDDAYRTILRSTAKVFSAKDLDNSGFEQVMAVMEVQGFVDSVHGDGYWTRKSEQRTSGLANERQIDLINRLAKSCRYCVPAQCEKFSKGRTPYPKKLTSGEAWKLIEMMKAANARNSRTPITEDQHAQPSLPF